MQDRFVRWATATAIIAVGLLLGVTTAAAQATDYRAPRTAAGSPDLNGIWQSINTANWDIEPHAAGPGMARELGAIAAVPAGLGIVDGGPIPYRPRRVHKGTKTSPTAWNEIPRSNAIYPACRAPPICPFHFRSFRARGTS